MTVTSSSYTPLSTASVLLKLFHLFPLSTASVLLRLFHLFHHRCLPLRCWSQTLKRGSKLQILLLIGRVQMLQTSIHKLTLMGLNRTTTKVFRVLLFVMASHQALRLLNVDYFQASSHLMKRYHHQLRLCHQLHLYQLIQPSHQI